MAKIAGTKKDLNKTSASQIIVTINFMYVIGFDALYL